VGKVSSSQIDHPAGLAIARIEDAKVCSHIILFDVQGIHWIPKDTQEARAGHCETKGGCGHRSAPTGYFYVVKQGATSPIGACLCDWGESGGAVSRDCYDRHSDEGKAELWEFVNNCKNLRNMATQRCLGNVNASPTPMADCGSGPLWTKAQAVSVYLANANQCKLKGGETAWWTVQFYNANGLGDCGLNIYGNTECSQDRFLFKGPGECWCLRAHRSDECSYEDTGIATYTFQAP